MLLFKPTFHINAKRSVIRAVAPPRIRFFTGKPRGTGSQQLTTEDADYEGAMNILNRYQSQNRQSPAQSSQHKRETPTERTRTWLHLLGHDVNYIEHMKVIHVAGTKGKGTACLYCNRILVEHQRITGAPKKIGCLTSPHQIDVRERILINNEKIPKSVFSFYIRELDRRINSLSSQPNLKTPRVPKYPGFLSLLAIYIFILEKVDVAILETGTGGETDSTNIFPRPIATGITTIGLDHMDVLGHSVEEIAWHKSGIFKPGSLAATVPQEEVISEVLRRRAGERKVDGKLQFITDQKVLEYGVKVDPDMRYQRYNAGLAIFLAEAYLKSADPHFSMTAEIARSLQDVELLGRSQVVEDGRNTWFLSSGHNEISLKETISWFKQSTQQRSIATAPRVLVFNQNFSRSSPRDPYPLLKVVYEGLRTNSPMLLQGIIFCTDQLGEDAEEKSDLIDFRINQKDMSSLHNQRENSRIWKELGGSGQVTIVHTTKEAVQVVKQSYLGAEVLVTGSSYLSGNVLHILRPAI